MNACSATTGLMRQFHRLFGVLVLSLFYYQMAAYAAPADVGKKTLRTIASVNHADTGIELALPNLSANPYALSANTGKQTVQFSVLVRLARTSKTPVTVFLRRKGDKQSIEMNDLGKNGDYVAKDGVFGVSVQIDTSRVKPDSCLQYETYIKQGRAEIVSPPLRLCVSTFPVRVATPNVDKPVVLDDGVKAVADEVLLYAKPTTSAATIRELALSINARVVGSIIPLNLYQLRLPSPVSAKRLLEIVAQLNTRAGIAGAAVNTLGQPAGHVDNTTDPEFANQDGVKLVLKNPNLAGTYVWDAGATGTGQTVVVADEGLDRTQPEFGISGDCQLSTVPVSGVVITDCGGTNNDNSVPGNLQWHGTRVAGVLAAKAYNSQGIAGVAHGSKIYSYKVASYALTDMDQLFYDLVPYVNAGASVINTSFSGGPWNPTSAGYALNVGYLCTAVNTAVSTGTGAIVVVAAGNNGVDDFYYPARCNQHANVSVANRSRIIAVGNSTSADNLSNCGSVLKDQRCTAAIPANSDLLGSNYGTWVDIMAPGSDIRTTTSVGYGDAGGNYTSSTGTSFSTPIVSGAVAILKSCGVPLDSIKSTLIGSATVNVPYPAAGSLTTTPRLDVYSALSSVNHAPTLSPTSSVSVDENSPMGTPISTLSASDIDTCDKLTYSVVGVNPGGFSVDANTGQLRVGGVGLDYEALPPPHSYTVTVQAKDFFELSATTPVTVNINNVNEAPVNTVPAAQAATENIAKVISGISVFDVDAGTAVITMTLTATNGTISVNPAAVGGVTSIAGNNTASIVLTGSQTQINATLSDITGVTYTPAANYSGPATLTVLTNDGGASGIGPALTDSDVININVAVNHAPVGHPVIDPPDAIGNRIPPQQLTALTSLISDADGPVVLPFHYQWWRDATSVGGDSDKYTLVDPDDIGGHMKVCVSYTDAQGTLENSIQNPNLCSATDATAVGDPHITTVDGLHYDFQSAGEFINLRGDNGMEIQTRQTPVSTASPLTDGYSGLTSGVSINTAVAARVGNHRVTFQPNISGNPASSGLELRVDGVVTTLPADGLDLGSGGRVVSAPGGGIQIDFPDQTTMIATPGWWAANSVWYLNVSVFHTSAYDGIMGARAKESWLPRLADGTALGAMPAAMHDRYVDLYVKFADSWRVNNKTSLFDYAKDMSTRTFTFKEWPRESPPYVIGDGPVAKPVKRQLAQQLCLKVVGKNNNADCMFDVMVMGDRGIAKTHLLSQKIRAGLTSIIVRDDRDTSKDKEVVTFTATVVRHSAITRLEAGGKGGPAGTVQFTLNGNKIGGQIRLDAKGQARLKVSRLKAEKQQIGARYIPAKGSVFLASSSIEASRPMKEGK